MPIALRKLFNRGEKMTLTLGGFVFYTHAGLRSKHFSTQNTERKTHFRMHMHAVPTPPPTKHTHTPCTDLHAHIDTFTCVHAYT